MAKEPTKKELLARIVALETELAQMKLQGITIQVQPCQLPHYQQQPNYTPQQWPNTCQLQTIYPYPYYGDGQPLLHLNGAGPNLDQYLTHG